MHADIDGALEAARIATGFDWTWAADDLGGFLDALGWQVSDRGPFDWPLTSPLEINRPTALVTGHGDEIKWVTLRVTDHLDEPDESAGVEFLANAFGELADRLNGIYGEPSRRISGAEPELRWDLDGVNIELSHAADRIYLNFVNPVYQARMDAIPPMREEYNYEV
ncbi:DUF6301 family protein [Nocardia sp. R16R-3T]